MALFEGYEMRPKIFVSSEGQFFIIKLIYGLTIGVHHIVISLYEPIVLWLYNCDMKSSSASSYAV